jgi:hypothetical protein
METINSSLVLASYNCRGFNNSELSDVNDLQQKCHFFFIQQHWLSNTQIDSLCNGNNTLVHGVSLFDPSLVLSGRSCGDMEVWPFCGIKI